MGQKASYALRDPNRLAGGDAVLDAAVPSGVARNCTSDVAYDISPTATTSECRGAVTRLASPQVIQTERTEFVDDPSTVELRRRPEMEERLRTDRPPSVGGSGDEGTVEVDLSGCTDEQIAELLVAQQKFSTASFEWQFPSALSMKRLMEEEPVGASNSDSIVVLANALADDRAATTKTRNVDDCGSGTDDQSEKTMGDEGGSDSTSNGDDDRTTKIQPIAERIDQPENDIGVTVTATVVEPLTTGRHDTNGDCVVSFIVVEEDDVTTADEKEEISALTFQELESAQVDADNQPPPANELSGRSGRGRTSLLNAVDEMKENELSRTADICEQLTKHATLSDVNSAQQRMDHQ